jgi:YVTN family beta-propeller protein
MQNHFRTLSFFGILLLAMPLAASTTRIWVLNMNGEGKNIQVIDPATNKIVQTIEGIKYPHGVAFSPDGSLAYVSSEDEQATNAIWVVDTKTGKILKSAPLSSRRGNVPAITNDGKRLLVCVGPPRNPKTHQVESGTGIGALDVVDTASLKILKSFPMQGHDCYTSPDGKYWIAGAGKNLTVIDVQTEKVLWQIHYEEGLGPIAIEANPDGSPHRLFVTPLRQGVRSFAVVDFATHKEVTRIKLPDEPGKFQIAKAAGLQRRNPLPVHGFAISPDGKTLVVGCRDANAVFFYSLPDLKLQGHFSTPTVKGAKHPYDGGDPGWMTFTPDGKTLYVASAAANVVSAVDMKTKKEVARIPVGKQPDHVYTVVMPDGSSKGQ